LAVRLRLRRVGRKKFPIYKVVAADQRSPRDGRFIEAVGQYEPLRESNNVEFHEDRVLYWLQNGAEPTDTVRSLLQKQGLWMKWSLIKKGADDDKIALAVEKFESQRAERDKQPKEKASKKEKEKTEDKASSESPEVTPEDRIEEKKSDTQGETAKEQTTEEKSDEARADKTEPDRVQEETSDEVTQPEDADVKADDTEKKE
jgi:small subunit ribosomal protein S16